MYVSLKTPHSFIVSKNTIQKSSRHEFEVTIFNRKCIFSVNQGGLRPLIFLPRILLYAMISEIEQKPGRPGSYEEVLRRTYAITPTFNSRGNFSVGATAFSGIVTVTPGKSGWLSKPPLDVMI